MFGLMNTLITIEQKQRVKDSIGGTKDEWTKYKDVYGIVDEETSGLSTVGEIVQALQLQYVRILRVIIYEDVDTDDYRFIIDGQKYNIKFKYTKHQLFKEYICVSE